MGKNDKNKNVCACAEKLKQKKKEPKLMRDDLLWAYFCIRMINEVLGDKASRDKLLEKRKDTGPMNMFELAILREIQKKDPGSFTAVPQALPASGAPKPPPTAAPKPPPPAPPAK